MKNRLMILGVLVLFVLSCGITLDSGVAPASQPPVVQVVTQVIPVQPSPIPQVQEPTSQPPPAVPTVGVTPTASEPPTITGKEPLDCLPYPHFGFLYDVGIAMGVPLQPIFKAEAKWSEPGIDWYEVKYSEGGANFDCWVYGGFVEKSGDFSKLTAHKVVIPWPPQPPYCDTAVKLAKVKPGVKVWLPWSQDMVRGQTGWLDGMWEYSGHDAKVMYMGGLDRSGCMTVFVDYDGGQFPWRVRNLFLSKP